MRYTFSINKKDKPQNAVYARDELTALTTLQLREVCQREKIVVGAAYKLDRAYLIDLILKYRGMRQNTFVDVHVPERFQRVLDRLNANLDFEDANHAIHTPTGISFYKGIDTTVYDRYDVEGAIICQGNALLLDDRNKICGILNIREYEGKYHITGKSGLLAPSLAPGLYRNYSIGFLTESGSRYLYSYYYETQKNLPLKVKCYVKDIAELRVNDVHESATALVIDFGTSNSSAGAYIDEHMEDRHVLSDLRKNNIKPNDISKVKFINTLSQVPFLTEIFPTVISVENCADPRRIAYRYGYDAIKTAQRNHFSGQASIFFGIKKWINNYEQEEELSDDEGNVAAVPRKDIIRAYFDYIIRTAEQQHKCKYKTLHITSPVKQKHQFLDMYRNILRGYEVLTETALDEGVAVLYNSISGQISDKNFFDGASYNALIIDCGGGTTDLTKCTYKIHDNRITHELNMRTTYANGETNFGGNNLTYRIFQYLKALFSNYYESRRVIRLEDLLDMDLDVYRFVDEHGAEKQYERLEELYAKAEAVLPTRFADYKVKFSEDYAKVKSNFYFLWNLAEKIKTDFFGSFSVIHTAFHKSGLVSAGHGKILAEESWMLYVYKSSKVRDAVKNKMTEKCALTLETGLPEVVISRNEVETLLKADIYRVIKKFIEPLYDNGDLDGINSIKLTGQTCKIDIFRDALKEFLPGLKIHSGKQDRSVHDLKLTCLEGAVKYQNAKKIGMIAPTIINESPITPYKLIAFTHTNQEVVMMEQSEKIDRTYGFVSRHIETESAELILLDAEERLLHKYPLSTSIKRFKNTTYEKLLPYCEGKVLQDDIDNIVNDEMKIFTFAYEDRWGFYVLPVARKDGGLLVGERKYLPFENTEWEINFFDGRK